ncbi:hypothetical protein EXM89_16660 [Clostridium botulinum]|nr:hypothetical protein [Clostridium botulinum]NFB61559.1 hypothetical protein [Clostridium botulinum]
MSKDKIEWAIYTNPESKEKDEVFYNDLNREEYESKYKGNLTCINECEARIKFTHKKNNNKFFSTWNGEGARHREDCPFHVEYRGKIGRNKLKAFYGKREINENDINNTLLNKIKGLRRKYNGEDGNKINVGTKEVEENGEITVPVNNAEEETYDQGISNRTRRDHNIMSIDASHLTTSYIGTRKCVYGIASNAQIGTRNRKDFGYINLKNRTHTVSIYFPEAFYSQENGITLDDFKRFINILKKEINEKPERNVVIVCYGEIKRKEKKGVNINIINENHIYINDMSVRKILSEGKLREIDYSII